jgi:2-C-methyl-D-erythritol 4-phosphate cytidylyltransferase
MVTALVAAAGAGERLGVGSPKALAEIAGRPLVAWCLAALGRASSVDALVIAAPEGFEDALRELCAEAAPELAVTVVRGGSSRSRSVANALAATTEAELVLVHDAARPLVTAELVDRCVQRLRGWRCDGVVAAARTTDTVKETDAGGRVIATLERGNLWAVQTPQVFGADVLRSALASAELERAYDDAQLVEARGGDVRVVEAPRENMKVTTAFDLRVAELLLSGRRA